MGNPQSALNYQSASVLRIYCFGKFRVIRPGETEVIGIVSKHKMWQLFKYLIINRRSVVPTLNLVNDLWPTQKNPEDTSAIRTTVCRLKSMLQPKSGVKQRYSYIIYRKDSCAFNLNAPFWLDIEMFEQLCAEAKKEGAYNREQAINIYIEALDLYQGDFLAEDPNMENAVSLREYYRLMFLDAVKELASWLIEMKDLARARFYLEKGIKTDPYQEEIQMMLIRILLESGDTKTAKAYYISYSALLYNELGVKPSPELKKLYNAIKEQEGHNPLHQVLNEDEKPVEEMNGPFSCDPELFWTCLLLERRRTSRSGNESSMVILELQAAEEQENRRRQTIFQQVQQVAQGILRKSDILCRLDHSHFALLLSSTGAQGAKTVATNILNRFYQEHTYDKKEIGFKTKVKLIST